MIDFTITEQLVEFTVSDEVSWEIIETGEQIITFETSGPQGPQGERGPPGLASIPTILDGGNF